MAARRDKRQPLLELTELLRARGVDAVYHRSDEWGRGYGWIALTPAGRTSCDDAVWYLRAGAQVNRRRLEEPEVVCGRHFQHHAPAGDLATAADQIAAHVQTRPTEFQAGEAG
jgi:hypothetical protein